MTRLVLAGIDGSAQSLAAAQWAADEAVLVGHQLRLIHAETWLDDIHADPGQPAAVRALTARRLQPTASCWSSARTASAASGG